MRKNAENIPELLVSIGGKKITSAEEWEKFRRPEVLALLEEYEYGRRPRKADDKASFEVKEMILHEEDGVMEKKILAALDTFSFMFRLYLPLERKGKVPAFVYLMTAGQEGRHDFEEKLNHFILPIPEICRRGYAVALLPVSKIYPDWENKANYEKGVYSVCSPDRKERRDSDWGGLSAWAWGASRILDYLETDDDVDAENCAVIGHSRCGKTALLCAALDARFKLSVSNSSGCGGAAMHRGKIAEGEHIKDIIITDWFCETYSKYSGQDDYLPVDQHMLLALMAPRNIYVQSSNEDLWAWPDGEVWSAELADEVYELYGKKGLVLEGEVQLDVPYHEGSIAYHRRSGAHQITEYDWKLYMDYADKILKK